MERIRYITDTCVSGFKDMDGKILSRLDCTDIVWRVCDLIDSDYDTCDIWEGEDEDSASLLDDSQYELVRGRRL